MEPEAIDAMARRARAVAAVRRTVEGSLVGAHIMGLDPLPAATEAAAAAVRAALRTGADAAGVALSAVEGAIDAARELKLDCDAAGAAAAAGAVRAAREAGGDAMERVRTAVAAYG